MSIIKIIELSAKGKYSFVFEQGGDVIVRHKRPKNSVDEKDDNYHLLRASGTGPDMKVRDRNVNVLHASLGCAFCRVNIAGRFQSIGLPFVATSYTEDMVVSRLNCKFRSRRQPSIACFDSLPSQDKPIDEKVISDDLPF